MALGKAVMLYPIRTEKERKYQSGVRYGDDKVRSIAVRILPGLKQIERFKSLEHSNKFYKLF